MVLLWFRLWGRWSNRSMVLYLCIYWITVSTLLNIGLSLHFGRGGRGPNHFLHFGRGVLCFTGAREGFRVLGVRWLLVGGLFGVADGALSWGRCSQIQRLGRMNVGTGHRCRSRCRGGHVGPPTGPGPLPVSHDGCFFTGHAFSRVELISVGWQRSSSVGSRRRPGRADRVTFSRIM